MSNTVVYPKSLLKILVLMTSCTLTAMEGLAELETVITEDRPYMVRILSIRTATAVDSSMLEIEQLGTLGSISAASVYAGMVVLLALKWRRGGLRGVG